jgi:hypothetical protein
MTRLDEVRARIAAAREAEDAQRDEQLASDLEAVFTLAEEYGQSRVRRVEIKAWTPGIPAVAAVRCPSKAEVKRFQARMREAKADRVKALEELAAVCTVYPEAGERREALFAACPALPVQLGQEAASLAIGEAQEEGKE